MVQITMRHSSIRVSLLCHDTQGQVREDARGRVSERNVATAYCPDGRFTSDGSLSSLWIVAEAQRTVALAGIGGNEQGKREHKALWKCQTAQIRIHVQPLTVASIRVSWLMG